MNDPFDRLYQLLPVVYRMRDKEVGEPLRALLRIMAEQGQRIEDDIARLYDNWFIETCDDWVVPYIGDLIGYRSVYDTGEPGRDRPGTRLLVPRRDVANTIRHRRCKGTLALLEVLADEVAGWPARAVEFHRLVAATQSFGHVDVRAGRTIDVGRVASLDLLGGAFDRAAHIADIRRVNSPHDPGHPNLAGVGVFVWRLRSYQVARTPAYCVEERGNHCFTFSVLGHDMPLFVHPEREASPDDIAGELNVPGPIRRHAFEERIRDSAGARRRASADYYGSDRSVAVFTSNPQAGTVVREIPRESIVPADLTDWKYRPRPGLVAVDPALGRLAFAPGQAPQGAVRVSYCYGFSADIGGGYDRPTRTGQRRSAAVKGGEAGSPNEDPRPVLYTVGKRPVADGQQAPDFTSLLEACDAWRRQPPSDAIIEIVDSDVYEEQLGIEIPERCRLELRAASGERPVLRLVDWQANRPDAFVVSGRPGSRFVLGGLLVTGRGIEIAGELSVTIQHTTVVPGWALHSNCDPRRPSDPSLTLLNTLGRVRIEHSIIGAIRVAHDEVAFDPIELHISDSVLDATGPGLNALRGQADAPAHVALRVARSTILGEVWCHLVELAENSIFDGRVAVERRQRGCLRFCYVPLGSATPSRFRCQPDLALTDLTGEERRLVELGVQPQFSSRRYGTPAYCQLAPTCADEILRGAEDRSEMGVFHDLYQPQRASNLQARLNEYTPAGTDVGIIYVT